MIKTTIDETRCKACGLCAAVCPKHIIQINGARLTQYGRGCAEVGAGCIGCGSCAAVCPDIAVTIIKEDGE